MSDAKIKEINVSQNDKKAASSATKEVFWIEIEAPSSKDKFASYLAVRADHWPAVVSMMAYRVKDKILAQIKDAKYNDALELCRADSELENILIPWQKVICIKTLKLPLG